MKTKWACNTDQRFSELLFLGKNLDHVFSSPKYCLIKAINCNWIPLKQSYTVYKQVNSKTITSLMYYWLVTAIKLSLTNNYNVYI